MNQIIAEMNEFKNKYYILENGDIMVVLANKAWGKVDEFKNLKGEICVKLYVDLGKYNYFRKEDLLNGIVEPIPLSEIQRRKNEKEVLQFKDGVLIKTFQNANVASRETDIAYAGIYNCCNGGRYAKSAGGFEWKYATDTE